MPEQDAGEFEPGDSLKAPLGLYRVGGEWGRSTRQRAGRRANDVAREQDRRLIENQAAMAGCVARRLKNSEVSDRCALHETQQVTVKGDRGLIFGSRPHDGSARTPYYLGQSSHVIRVAVSQHDVGDVIPSGPDPQEPGTNGVMTSDHTGIDQDYPAGVRHQKTSDVEVEGLGSGHASGQMDVHHDRFDAGIQWSLPTATLPEQAYASVTGHSGPVCEEFAARTKARLAGSGGIALI